MNAWWWKRKSDDSPGLAEQTIRNKYACFRELLSYNNECLELLASIQEDLQYALPSSELLGDRAATVFDRTESVVQHLEQLSGRSYGALTQALRQQRQQIEHYIAATEEMASPRLSAWLSEVSLRDAAEVGGKAAALAEIKNKLGLPVPEGYVLTAQAYRQFCEIPLWTEIRDATRNVDLNDLEALQAVSTRLIDEVLARQLPRAIEVALAERAVALVKNGVGLAVRSSAVGEGGQWSFAGQFVSLINVLPDDLLESYKQVVAARFSARALFYRLSAGLTEVDTPLAVLCLQMVPAKASGIMYTRNPNDPSSETLWVTATHGLGIDIASGASPADLFVLARKRHHRVLDQRVPVKPEKVVPGEHGGLMRQPLSTDQAQAPSLNDKELAQLANLGLEIEKHFAAPQDIEWALDEDGQLWILQSRPLSLAASTGVKTKSRVKQAPLLEGGYTVFPGRVSGTAHLAQDRPALQRTPQGAILFLRKASPEMVEVFPRIAGLVAEWGNLAGHGAALLREFRIPSIFQLSGAFEQLHDGDQISLDAVQPRVYSGALWPSDGPKSPEHLRVLPDDPIRQYLLELNLHDPSSLAFRPSGCKSAHDVLRFCHEKAIAAMFEVDDMESARQAHSSKRLMTPVPINFYVLDLGGGLAPSVSSSTEVRPEEIVSRPFQALWQGVSHPGVAWTRAMPASISDLASVMATGLSAQSGATRALGEKSYLLVADEYMNLNSRLAYHFTLVDACMSDIPSNNYVAFRFAGGGATRQRRNLRACFIEACLAHYGFVVDRREDLVNAWYKKAPPLETGAHLDLLGRLMACTSQLDMYMTGEAAMKWYVQQFLQGNYDFSREEKSARQ
jgi:pyruvate,water dikinase